MRRKILNVRSAAKGRKSMKFMPGVWAPRVLITKDAVVIAQRIESHYVVSIMRMPTDLGGICFLHYIHSSTFFSLLRLIIMKGVKERPDAQRRDKKGSG